MKKEKKNGLAVSNEIASTFCIYRVSSVHSININVYLKKEETHIFFDSRSLNDRKKIPFIFMLMVAWQSNGERKRKITGKENQFSEMNNGGRVGYKDGIRLAFVLVFVHNSFGEFVFVCSFCWRFDFS